MRKLSCTIYASLSLLILIPTILCFNRNKWTHTIKSNFQLNMAGKAAITIGTRGSPLALAQAYETKRLLGTHFPELAEEGAVEIQKIMTKGDSILNQALSEIGGKGLFTKELDTALLDKSVDICVHSMKDVPTYLPEGTVLPCMLQREKTNDVFISKKYKSFDDLPDGAVIGSASLRRQAQLLSMNPTWKVVNFRGNVQTRLKKIENGVVDATLLAVAGLHRLGMNDLINTSHVIPWDDMLPAVAQGAIGIQCRSDDTTILKYLEPLNHNPTKLAVDCERAFLAKLDGNCRTPIAGQAWYEDGALLFKGMISKPDGKDILTVSKRAIVNSEEEAVVLGTLAGAEIRNRAGPRFEEYHHAISAASSNIP